MLLRWGAWIWMWQSTTLCSNRWFKSDPLFQETFRLLDPDWHWLLKMEKKSLADIRGKFYSESLIVNLGSKIQLSKYSGWHQKSFWNWLTFMIWFIENFVKVEIFTVLISGIANHMKVGTIMSSVKSTQYKKLAQNALQFTYVLNFEFLQTT